MVSSICKLFNLYPGEGKKTLLFAITGLLWSSGVYGCLILSEGMFLEKVGAADLPKVYFFLSIGLCLLSTFILLAISRLRPFHLVLAVISSAVAVYSTFFFLLHTHLSTYSTFWYLFRALGSFFDVSVYVCFCAFVDYYFDLQQVKRLFCLFTAVLFLGDAIGGMIISWGLSSLGLEGLLLFFITITFLSMPCLLWISKSITPVLEEHVEGVNETPEETLSFFFKSIFRSRFTLILMLAYFVMNMLAIVTEYTSFEAIELFFKNRGEENRVAQFLGSISGWVSLSNMFFGLFFYSRLTKKVGVINTILIAPIFFLAIMLLWLTGNFIHIAVLGVIARQGMTYTFEDNNLTLLISGVPSRIKNQARVAIEMFLEPMGMCVSACLLTILQQDSNLLALALSFLALCVMFLLRAEYAKALLRNLIDHSIRFEKQASDWLKNISKKEKKKVEFLLFSVIKKADEKIKLLAYEGFLKIADLNILPKVLQQLSCLSLPSKIKAIDLLMESPFAKESTVLDLLTRWKKTIPHPAIIGTIHFYFARHGLISPYRLADDLHNDHLIRKGAAILSFKTYETKKPECELYTIAIHKLDKLLISSDENEICMGLKIFSHEENPLNLPQLLPFMKHLSLKVRELASLAIKKSASTQGSYLIGEIVELLPQLSENISRLHLLEALEKMDPTPWMRELLLTTIHFRTNERKMIEKIALKIGLSIKELLISIIKDATIHPRCRLLAGKILGRISLGELQKDLDKIISQEIEKAYFYFYYGHAIQKNHPEYDLRALENALLSNYESAMDFIIQLIGIDNRFEESEVLAQSVKSKNQKLRAQALETLEKATPARIFTKLELLLSNRKLEEKLQFYIQRSKPTFNLWELLDKLENSHLNSDRLIALSLKMGFQPSRQENEINTKEFSPQFNYELIEK